MNFEVGNVAKVGQYPELREPVSPELAKKLDEDHLKYYRTAIRLRNFNLGIGALSYIRRVVEDTVNDLLDVVIDEARRDGEDVTELERAKAGHNFDAKMEIAKCKLPKRLMPGGHNPLDKLHDLASSGIHALSDEQCSDKFDQAREVFEFFFEELPRRQAREAKFTKSLSDMNKP